MENEIRKSKKQKMLANAVDRPLRLYKNLPIRHKLLLILYIQIIIPLIFIGYMSYKSSEEIIRNKSVAYSQDILRMIGLRLKDYVNNLTIISQNLLYDKKIYNVLDSENSKVDPIHSYESSDEVKSVLEKVMFSRPEIQSICFVSNRSNYYYYDNNSEKTRIKYILPGLYERILAKARKAQGRVAWYVDSSNSRAENVFLVRTIYNRDNFKEIGLMVMLVRKEYLETVYQDLINEDIENIAIISSNNDRISSRQPDYKYLYETGLQNKIEHSNGIVEDDNRGILVSYIQMEDPDWKVIAYISLKHLYKDIVMLRQLIMILSVISVILLSVLSVFIAIDLINPIKKLVNGMKKVQKGEGDVEIDVDRDDELGFLSKTFNKMAKEINHLVNWIYREQITRKEAELKALQSQINPHFLFNTLEAINWMARLNNIPEISDTVTDLASLMEAGIGRDDKLITLEEEFTYSDKYISLLKRRFEDRIELVKNVQDEILDVKIPRLLIQPLIENAVYHGVEHSSGKGVINLNAYINGGKLVIEVIDNGIGIEKNELDALNQKLEMDNDTYFKYLAINKNKSIGIENVNRRIKLFYGEDYGLNIESQAGRFTRVMVTVPIHRESIQQGYYIDNQT